ncbi:GNAT family N-acetyltransferase [Leifsonia poae]|uniref:N-acetyltransferase n=1 Tax=Leifsonia poae TaxID=110933 RepID=A0A9W6H9K7_9MICO|nr:GNAT family N-acetyltransferase [Leifsonia poae]GLJ76090.1 N-acetyltransferase [Leifsonia poae]
MTLTVVNEPDASRYALRRDGDLIGVAEYELRDDAIVFTHTEVDESLREKGLASQLVTEALDDVRANSARRVVVACPYIRHWLTEHPEYGDLLKR